MPGRGPSPKPEAQRRTRHEPTRGEYQSAPGVGWQHGDLPRPPAKLMGASRTAWGVWMRSWFAAHWTPDDLPGLRQVIRLYDQVERGEYVRMTELRQMMDNYGITPKGQQDRRWTPPRAEQPAAEAAPAAGKLYGHLRAVGE